MKIMVFTWWWYSDSRWHIYHTYIIIDILSFTDYSFYIKMSIFIIYWNSILYTYCNLWWKTLYSTCKCMRGVHYCLKNFEFEDNQTEGSQCQLSKPCQLRDWFLSTRASDKYPLTDRTPLPLLLTRAFSKGNTSPATDSLEKGIHSSKSEKYWGFPGSPVVRTLHFHHRRN